VEFVRVIVAKPDKGKLGGFPVLPGENEGLRHDIDGTDLHGLFSLLCELVKWHRFYGY
jgi:hypothetical protein